MRSGSEGSAMRVHACTALSSKDRKLQKIVHGFSTCLELLLSLIAHVDFTIGSSISKSAQSVVPGTGSSIFRRSPNVI